MPGGKGPWRLCLPWGQAVYSTCLTGLLGLLPAPGLGKSRQAGQPPNGGGQGLEALDITLKPLRAGREVFPKARQANPFLFLTPAHSTPNWSSGFC